MRPLLALVGLVLLTSGCGGPASTTDAPAAADPPAAAAAPDADGPQGTVVGHVRWRDGKVTITAGDAGPRYSVASVDGAWLARDLSYDQLADRFPTVEALVRTSVASMGIDASLDTSHRRSPRDGRGDDRRGGPTPGPALRSLD